MKNSYTKIVLNDTNWHNRIHALEHIHDQEVLFKVALKDYDYRIRSEAIKRILKLNNPLSMCTLRQSNDYLVKQYLAK